MAQASCAASAALLCVPAVDTDSLDCHCIALRGECREADLWYQQKCGMSCSLSHQGPLLFRDRSMTIFAPLTEPLTA
jgi:hypothetical protein